MKDEIGTLMRHAQAMQDNIRKAQSELSGVEVTGQAGAGMVEIVMTCQYAVRRVNIDPVLMSDDKEVLEDLVAAAINDVMRKVETTSKEKVGNMASQFDLSSLKLPF